MISAWCAIPWREKGTAIVEFAIAIPLLVILLIGLVDIGFILCALLHMEQSAREGVRTAARIAELETDVLEDQDQPQDEVDQVAACNLPNHGNIQPPERCGTVIVHARVRQMLRLQGHERQGPFGVRVDPDPAAPALPYSHISSQFDSANNVVRVQVRATYEGLFFSFPITASYAAAHLF